MCDKKIDIYEKAAIKAYNEADEKGKKMISTLLGEKSSILNQNIMDRIHGFNDILELAGTNLREFDKKFGHLSAPKYALEQLELIATVLNEGWYPNWGDSNEYKYYPYFVWDKSRSGFGFSYAGYNYVYSLTSVGSRLVFRNAKLAEFAGKLFMEIYNTYIK